MGSHTNINSDCPGSDSKTAGKAEQCKGCPNAKICSSETVIDPDIALIQENLQNFDIIIAVMSGKGGVGKSTITRNLAESFEKRRIQTLILDLDLSGPSMPKLTNTEGIAGIEVNNKLEAVRVSDYIGCISVGYFLDENNIYSSKIKTKLLKNILLNSNFSPYKAMLIDTPPNITDEHLGLVNFIKPNCAIVVTTPQTISYQDVLRQISFCRKTNIEIKGIVENMKRSKCSKCGATNNIFNDCGIENKCNDLGIKYFGSIPIDAGFGRLSDEGRAIQNVLFDEIVEDLLLK
ncbi:Cytosolic Fe-S cluster assembly factor NUBP1 [Nosema granulosis]|uniref:Cytosolic Fe-S cluster assembly factor NUBP1 n=1 Tax=Nosema granulosis TaxID=83296 RepID=A0A9P6H104_9MICR|nr:Cytosolic Fe-S cluster assembly factor NUBP1 [Nosema granulosis]